MSAKNPAQVALFERWIARYNLKPDYAYSVSSSDDRTWSVSLSIPGLSAHCAEGEYPAVDIVDKIPAPERFLTKDEIRDNYQLRESFVEWAEGVGITRFVLCAQTVLPPAAWAKEPTKLDAPKPGEVVEVDGLDLQ